MGVGPERAARNLARFRQVIQMAADRGIKVGYMNYEALPPIGPWKTRHVGLDDRWTQVPQEFLEGPRPVQYTREAVLSFLKQLPGLWMFGFRVGESGQPEGFYQKTYLAALAELPPTQKVYLRTWIADPQKVRELAASTKNQIYIEPKYNGEQLGLPYEATLDSRQYARSGSYENYTDNPQNYSIIWRARRSLPGARFRSCKFGNGVGFPMQPMEAICLRPTTSTTTREDYYFGANSGRWGDYDETIAHWQPFHLPVSQSDSKPLFSYTAPAAPVMGNSVTLHVNVRDQSTIKSVHLYYKLMPSYYEWRQIEIAPDGNGNYTALVPQAGRNPLLFRRRR